MKCEFCGESYENQKALDRHLRSKHGDKIKLIKFEHPLKRKVKVKKKL